MANEGTMQTSCIQENSEADDFQENIPPEFAAAGTAKPGVQGEDVEGFFSTRPRGESKPLSDMCTAASPASSNGGAMAKSLISGVSSALTPVLKYLNIGMKHPSAEPVRHGNIPHQTVHFFPLGNTASNGQKTTGSVSQHPTSDFSNSHSGRLMEDKHVPLHWLDDEYFPEISLLDVTCDTTMQLTRTPKTPASARGLVRNPEQFVHINRKIYSTLTPKMDTSSSLSPPGKMSYLEVTRDISPGDSFANSGPPSEVMAEMDRLDAISAEELSSTLPGNVTHTIGSINEQSDLKSAVENATKTCLDVTQDISVAGDVEKSRPSPETSVQNISNIQTQVERIPDTQAANVTHDMNSSDDVSALCTMSQFPTFNMQGEASSKDVTSELHTVLAESSDAAEANKEDPSTSRDTDVTGKLTELNLKSTGSVNSTFTTLHLSGLSLNSTSHTSCPQNRTVDLPASNVSGTITENEATAQASSASENATEAEASVTNQNCPAVKASGLCDVQNTTFESQKPTGHTVLEGAGATTFCPQNNTFDSKPPSERNGNITMSQTSSSDCQNTLERTPSPNDCHPETSTEPNDLEGQPRELLNHSSTSSIDTNTKIGAPLQSTFEANPAAELASGAAQCETKDHSQSARPLTDGLPETLGHQSMDMDNSTKTNTFNLDDTLELRTDSLITSTPMTTCKIFQFNTQREEGKMIVAQKRLYGDCPGKPVGQVPSDVPPNIVCGRKTFLTQPAAKSLLPHTKAASQLLKFKPASARPGCGEPPTSGLPMTRQRTQAATELSTAVSAAPQETTGILSTYNLRASTTGSKQPCSGLQRLQMTGIQSGVHRAAAGLRPPSARNNAPASASTDKLRRPTASNIVAKTAQTKKHPLTRGEPLPVAKKKKLDAPSSSSRTEAPVAPCDAMNRAKSLRQPAACQRALPAKAHKEDAAVPASSTETSALCDPACRAKGLKPPAARQKAPAAKAQSHGCANCVTLEQQLKLKSQEIQRLKEELLKYTKQEDEC